jgi:hypothetical protein
MPTRAPVNRDHDASRDQVRGDVPPVEGDGHPKLPAVGAPQLQVFTTADQEARRTEVITTWNRAFAVATSA